MGLRIEDSTNLEDRYGELRAGVGGHPQAVVLVHSVQADPLAYSFQLRHPRGGQMTILQ